MLCLTLSTGRVRLERSDCHAMGMSCKVYPSSYRARQTRQEKASAGSGRQSVGWEHSDWVRRPPTEFVTQVAVNSQACFPALQVHHRREVRPTKRRPEQVSTIASHALPSIAIDSRSKVTGRTRELQHTCAFRVALCDLRSAQFPAMPLWKKIGHCPRYSRQCRCRSHSYCHRDMSNKPTPSRTG